MRVLMNRPRFPSETGSIFLKARGIIMKRLLLGVIRETNKWIKSLEVVPSKTIASTVTSTDSYTD